MKTYKNLWEQFISAENFELAAKKAVRSKKSKKSTQNFLAHKDELLAKLRQQVMMGKFKTSEYKIFFVFEPKKREIYNLPLYPDHILHHALINVLGPIWQSLFIHDSYACIPGRGLHAASRRTMEFVRRNKYCLQCDIRKFYPSISHEIMMNIISRKIHDRRILRLLREIVFSIGGGKNLPIGNLTSQWMGNVYMNELDQFVKSKLRWRDYIRYCDDFCLYGNDKKELNRIGGVLQRFLGQNLGLTFSKCNIRKTENGITFIGYRHFPGFILLRKQTARKIKNRIKNIIFHKDFSFISIGQITAAYGWIKCACTYNYREYLYALAKFRSPRMNWFVRKNLPLA